MRYHRFRETRKESCYEKEDIDMLEFWLGGILSVLLLMYLVYVLVKPEDF